MPALKRVLCLSTDPHLAEPGVPPERALPFGRSLSDLTGFFLPLPCYGVSNQTWSCPERSSSANPHARDARPHCTTKSVRQEERRSRDGRPEGVSPLRAVSGGIGLPQLVPRVHVPELRREVLQALRSKRLILPEVR